MKFNLEAEKIFQFIGHSSSVYCLHPFDPDSFLSSGSEGVIARWNLNNGFSEGALARVDASIYSIKTIPGKDLLIAADSQGVIHVIDYRIKKELKALKIQQGTIFNLLISEELNRLFSVSADGSLLMIDLENLKPISKIQLCTEKVRCLALSPNQEYLAVGCGDGFIRLFNPYDLSKIFEFQAHDMAVNALRFSESGDELISGSKDAHLKSWRLENNHFELNLTIPAHNFAIYGIENLKGTPFYATASRDKTIKIWHKNDLNFLLRINKEKQDAHTHSVNSILWHKEKEILLSAGDDRKIMAWKIKY